MTLRLQAGMLPYRGFGGALTGATDPFFSNVVFLSSFDGTDGQTSATDDSPTTPHTINFIGTAQLDDAQVKFGTTSLLLDGNSDVVYMATDADWNFGSGAWTVEAFYRPRTTDARASGHFVAARWGTTGQLSFAMGQTAAGSTVFCNASADGTNSIFGGPLLGGSLTAGAWHHIAMCFDTATYYLLLDGAVIDSFNSASVVTAPAIHMAIGSNSSLASFFADGHIDEVRITKGTARYTGSYAVPNAAFPRA